MTNRTLSSLLGRSILALTCCIFPAIVQGQTAPAAPSATGDVNYDLRLQELEDRVSAFKQDVFRSKSRLFLLREQILRRTIGGSRAAVEHVNNLGDKFVIIDAAYVLDGNRIEITNKLEDPRFQVFDASVLPGAHNLSVQLKFRGRDFGGVFAYMNEITIDKAASYPFTVDEGRTVGIQTVAFDSGEGDILDPNRFRIRFEVEEFTTHEEAPAAATPASKD